MIPQFNNNLLASFGLFLDHEICAIGSGFSYFSGQLYPTYDPNYQGYNMFGSPFRQFVADSCVQNAYIPSGFYQGNIFVPATGSNTIDFLRGRVVSTTISSGATNLTAAYSIKDFNIYFSNVEEEILLFETAPTLPNQSKIGIQPTGALNYRVDPYPCIFISQTDGNNIPWAFGGLDETNSTMRCVVLSSDNWKLDSVMSLLQDTVRKYFPVFSGGFPYDYLGGVGTGYNYCQMVCSAPQMPQVYINSVKIKKLGARVDRLIGDQVTAGIVEFDLQTIRAPRIYK